MRRKRTGNIYFFAPSKPNVTPSPSKMKGDPFKYFEELLERARNKFGSNFEVQVYVRPNLTLKSGVIDEAFINTIQCIDSLAGEISDELDEFYTKRSTLLYSKWKFIRWKASLLLKILSWLPISSRYCPFCLEHDDECDECEYAKIHEPCDDSFTSTVRTILELRTFARRVIQYVYLERDKKRLDEELGTIISDLERFLFWQSGYTKLCEFAQGDAPVFRARFAFYIPTFYESFLNSLEKFLHKVREDSDERTLEHLKKFIEEVRQHLSELELNTFALQGVSNETD